MSSASESSLSSQEEEEGVRQPLDDAIARRYSGAVGRAGGSGGRAGASSAPDGSTGYGSSDDDGASPSNSDSPEPPDMQLNIEGIDGGGDDFEAALSGGLPSSSDSGSEFEGKESSSGGEDGSSGGKGGGTGMEVAELVGVVVVEEREDGGAAEMKRLLRMPR